LEAAEQPAGERGRALLLAHAGVDHQYHAGQGRDRPLQRFGGVGPWPRSRGVDTGVGATLGPGLLRPVVLVPSISRPGLHNGRGDITGAANESDLPGA
jgi:hypothetical protein